VVLAHGGRQALERNLLALLDGDTGPGNQFLQAVHHVLPAGGDDALVVLHLLADVGGLANRQGRGVALHGLTPGGQQVRLHEPRGIGPLEPALSVGVAEPLLVDVVHDLPRVQVGLPGGVAPLPDVLDLAVGARLGLQVQTKGDRGRVQCRELVQHPATALGAQADLRDRETSPQGGKHVTHGHGQAAPHAFEAVLNEALIAALGVGVFAQLGAGADAQEVQAGAHGLVGVDHALVGVDAQAVLAHQVASPLVDALQVVASGATDLLGPLKRSPVWSEQSHHFTSPKPVCSPCRCGPRGCVRFPPHRPHARPAQAPSRSRRAVHRAPRRSHCQPGSPCIRTLPSR